MNSPSGEQQAIIDYMKQGYNVVVDACAGSGKSTTVLSIAQQCPEKQIIQITYNSMLRHEIKEKIKVQDLSNISAHTYHSLAVRYYSETAYTDTELRTILMNNVRPREDIPRFDYIIIDEAQFFTDLKDFVVTAVDTYEKDIICVGLDGDSERNPFGQIIDLVPYADNIRKFKAYCTQCADGTHGIFSYRRAWAPQTQISVGNEDQYEALCRKHYLAARKLDLPRK